MILEEGLKFCYNIKPSLVYCFYFTYFRVTFMKAKFVLVQLTCIIKS